MQTYLVQRIASYLSEELQTQVTVGGVDISFFMNIVLVDVSMLDRNQQVLLSTGRMVFDIEKVSLRHRFLSINKIFFEEAFVGLTREEEADEYNFQFIIDYFSIDEKESSARRWDVVCKSFEFKKSGFSFNDRNLLYHSPGFDAGNFYVKNFNLGISDIIIDHDSLVFDLDYLSFASTGDFSLDHLAGKFAINSRQATVSQFLVSTPLSDFSVDLLMEYDGYEAFSDIINLVEISILINQSHIDLADVGYFIPYIFGTSGKVYLSGAARGTVSDLRGNNLNIVYGNATKFNGNLHIKGLPDIDQSNISFHVNEFSTHTDDIFSFSLPYWSATSAPDLPPGFNTLGWIIFDGSVTGNFNDFRASGNLKTDIGKASADMRFSRTNGQNLTFYEGDLKAIDFDMGTYFDKNESMGTVSFNARIKGRGFTLETIETDFSGEVEHISLSNYNYRNLKISGAISERSFAGYLAVNDQNLVLDFNGLINLEADVPVFDFHAKIDHANLSHLNIYQRDTAAYSAISADMTLSASGASLDQMVGSFNVSELTYYEISLDDEQETVFFCDDFFLSNESIDDVHHHFKLRSGFLDADLHGRIHFNRLAFSSEQFASLFVPSGFDPDSNNDTEKNGQDFIFDFRFLDTEILTSLFIPGLNIAPKSYFNGAFDSNKQVLFFSGYSDELFLKGSRLVNLELSGSRKDNIYSVGLESQKLMFTDSIFIEQFQWRTDIFNDSVSFDGFWANRDAAIKNHGHIQGKANFFDRNHVKLQILPSYAFVNDSLWQITGGNEIVFDTTATRVNNLMIFKNDEFIKAEGVLGKDPGEMMNLTFHNFNVDNFDFIFQEKNLEFSGIINGDISFSGIGGTPDVNAGLEVKDFGFNGDHLGDLKLNSIWNNDNKGFMVDADIIYYGNIGQNTPVSVSGYFYPDRQNDNFDLDIRLENLKMSIFSRYLEGFAQNFRGMASGNIRLEGPANSPELSGNARLVRTGFRVDYLNTSYTFAHEVEVGKDFFRFNNLVLNDTIGQSAILNGSVYHRNFKNFSLDLFLQPDRMILLNTTAAHNDLYYGRAFVSGLAHIYGPANDIVMDISARTNRGTQIFLPLGYSGEVTENSFITFISHDTTFVATGYSPPEITGITLNFDLDVTPDAEVQLIFDSQIGDIIRGRGTGNLKFEITSLGAFNMYGDYIIEEGDYLFTLQNLINKRFRIEQGGSIRWAGDPYDADIDLRAVYRLRTPLYDLMMDVDTSDVYRRRVPVETVLELKDKLFNPSITFDISLPGSDESTRELLERLITTEQEMNRQVFSLLVLNRFMPTSMDQYNTALGYGVGSTSSELLSNQLSNWLSQISSDFDIGINYRPGDEISSQELEVALSTQIFDDRVTIDGNVGVAGNHPATNRTSTLIGDVVVEVKITPEGKFRVKAFNRSNTFDIMHNNSPYSQGVGVFYRREFDSLNELWRRSRNIPNEIEYPEIDSE